MQMHLNPANDLLQAIGLRQMMINISNLSQNFELHLFINSGDQNLIFLQPFTRTNTFAVERMPKRNLITSVHK